MMETQIFESIRGAEAFRILGAGEFPDLKENSKLKGALLPEFEYRILEKSIGAPLAYKHRNRIRELSWMFRIDSEIFLLSIPMPRELEQKELDGFRVRPILRMERRGMNFKQFSRSEEIAEAGSDAYGIFTAILAELPMAASST